MVHLHKEREHGLLRAFESNQIHAAAFLCQDYCRIGMLNSFFQGGSMGAC